MNIYIRLDAYISKKHLQLDGPSSKKITELLTIEDAIQVIYAAEDSNHVKTLYDALGERDVTIVFSNYFYDVYEKIRILNDDVGLDVLFIDKVTSPTLDAERGIMKANIVDVLNFIKHRRRRDNILYFSVNPVWRLVILYLIRTAFPGIKILLYKYDWLNLFCPYEYREILQRFLQLPMGYIESEYKVMDMILKGEIVDGILYKDGGEEFDVLKDYSLPKLFFPAYLPEQIHQEPARDVMKPNRFVYLGKLFSPVDCIPELFTDAFLIDVFNEIAQQEFLIDVYYVRSTEDTVRKYLGQFNDSENVRIIEGRPLDKLLPSIAGKYHWGYLVNNYRDDFSVIRKHVEAALPARILTFLALGLPVVLSEELKYAADFVRKHNIGVVVPAKDIPRIGLILKGIDYGQLQRNVLELRENLSLEKQQTRFVSFIRRILDKR